GNDSGWDNATVFVHGVPLKSPDLAAFLCLQMQCLAEVAQRLDKPRAARQWQRRAAASLQKLLARYWRGDSFIAFGPADNVASEGDSLLLFLPIVLGRQLPAEIATRLVAGLRDEQRFLAPFGMASESFTSPLYRADSYWRGPGWAPATLLIVEGLAELGEHFLARAIAQRFCAAVQKSGCAENFDVFTGRGLRDPAHTWTASVFLILARDYLGNKTNVDAIV
ncbi:MAG TPA: trehalase family glycosidase, partial [Spongiibacteraceae bacterium]|nr:trehalase family glycosidase [Spongiibacteraceae bacterium]